MRVDPTPSAAAVPHVVIVGGGFAGLAAARQLRRAPVRITLVDRRNHHLFQPLLYQVATAALNPGDIAYPIRSVLRSQQNARTILGRVTGIDLRQRQVQLADEVMPFDYLLLATGATHSYFGQDGWEAWAPGLKTIEDALEIRRRVLSAFEAAERQTDPAMLPATLTFVVVGAGPTGVELAGALSEIGRQTVAKDFRSFDPRLLRVVLVEGADRVLPPYAARLSAKAEQQLRRLGVEVRTGAKVTRIDASGVWLGDEHIAARTVLWAAGVAASPLGASLGVPTDRAGRVKVQPDLSVPGHPNVFIAGDLMHFEQQGLAVPGVAPAALQAGRAAARNIAARVAGAATRPFRYRDKGSLATIGRAKAVGQIGRVQFTGFFAWWVWWIVHIAYLIGFRNRIAVMMGWAWQYFAFARGARLITGRAWEPGRAPEAPAVPPVPQAPRTPEPMLR
ncbi:MAG: NAD(P)/FAD-dependent oxidoreductase [Planctomycetes bacterium]|jgi:NADH dehydrogenase|nr:NAD(P)/FAD-dependent oxidoreductase [Planctomycetota bacterium]